MNKGASCKAVILLLVSFVFLCMAVENLMSLSLGDLYATGRGDERVDTPKRLENAMTQWQRMFKCSIVLWRIEDQHLDFFEHSDSGYVGWHFKKVTEMRQAFDIHKAGRDIAHRLGMKIFLNFSFDDGGWPHVVDGCNVYYCYQDKTLIAHPEYQEVDRREVYHYGYLDLSNPEARKFMVERIAKYMNELQMDGLYLNSRTHSGVYSQDKNYKDGPHHADRFGFGKNLVQEYKRRYGIDITSDPRFDYRSNLFAPQSVEVENWRRLRGEYFIIFYKEVKQAIGEHPLILSLPLSKYMGSSGGNIYVDHERIIREKVGNALVLGVSSGYVPPEKQKSLGYLSSEAHEANFNVPTFEQFCKQYGAMAQENGIRLYTLQQFAYNKAVEKKIEANPYHAGMMISHLSLQNFAIFPDAPAWRPMRGVFCVEAVCKPSKVKTLGQLVSKYNHRDTTSNQRGWSLILTTAPKDKDHLIAQFRCYVRWPIPNVPPEEYPSSDLHVNSDVRIPWNEWCHIAGAIDMDNSKMHIFVNGKKAGELEIPRGAYLHQNDQTDVCIGAYSGYRSTSFAGLVDYVRVSNCLPKEFNSIPDYTGKEIGTVMLTYFDNEARTIVQMPDSPVEFIVAPTFREGRNGRKALWFNDEENRRE